VLPQQVDNTPLAVADYELRQNDLLATELQSKEFIQILQDVFGDDIGIFLVKRW
jgi:hypothetical protein